MESYAKLFAAFESGHTVITGNNRLARTLRHAYDERQRGAGRVVWPSPVVLSWSAWQLQLWELSRLRQGVAASRVALPGDAADVLWQQAIAIDDDTQDPRSVARLASLARRSWGTVNDWQAATAPEWSAADLGPDEQAFLRWSGHFRDRCDALGAIDPERLLEALVDDAAAGVFSDLGPLLLAGCDDLPPLRRMFLERLQSSGVELSLQTTAMQPAIDLRGAGYPTVEAELRAAAGWARECIEANPTAALAVVIPDLASRAPAVRRTFHDVFAPDWRVAGLHAGLPLNVSVGVPLAATPIVRAALGFLGLVHGPCEFDEFSLLLRSPWLAGGRTEAAGRARAELRLRERVGPAFWPRDALPTCRRFAPDFAGLLDALLAETDPARAQPASGWAEHFSARLEAAEWPATGQLDSESWQTLQAWNELLGRFAAAGELLGAIGQGAALTLLRQMANDRLYQPEGPAAGVQVIGALEASGHCFDGLWISGMARELWPPAARPDSFVPLPLQRRLSMPDSSAAASLDYYRRLTLRLLASAPEVRVSWPAEQDGEALAPSPLLGDGLQTEAPCDLLEARNEQLLAAGATELLETDPPPPWAGTAPVRGGVSVLNRQAVSPLNAFIEKRLGAAEIQAPVLGIDARQRGNVTHRALELFYTAYPCRDDVARLSADERQAALREALEQAVADLPGIRQPFMRLLADREIDVLTARLDRFLIIDMARDSFTVVEREEGREVKVGALTLRIKLDRLDELAGGSRIVIDYKTGQVGRQAWNPAAPRDLQLPLYVAVVVPDAAGVGFAQIATTGVGYEGVGDDSLAIEGFRVPGGKRSEASFRAAQSGQLIESWDELRAEWSAVLEDLAAEFVAGDFRLDPRNPDSARGQFAVLSRLYDSAIGIWEDDA